MFIVLGGSPTGRVTLTEVDSAGVVLTTLPLSHTELLAEVARREPSRPRWVWDDTSQWYPALLSADLTVERCHDLRLCHNILRLSEAARGTELALGERNSWDDQPVELASSGTALFDDLADLAELSDGPADDEGARDPIAEYVLQRSTLDAIAATAPEAAARLQLLLAAESSGALIAEEMRTRGLPWSTAVHNAALTELLGPRPMFGGRPEKLEALSDTIRTLLQSPGLNPDSQQELLRALKRAGLTVTSTSKWELRSQKHPVVEPLLEYKKLSRLNSANGWAWMDAWVRDGRFRPEYVVGGVVTGRWATRGGGALQLPAQIRGAVRADDGWTLVVADAAQLEPRIIAAMSRDEKMAAAGRQGDLYQGLVDAGVVDTRAHAKVAMLGALYGATTGESARLMPKLAKAYPVAIGLVENAARTGERGDQVSTWLGRSSPRPGEAWHAAQRAAAEAGASPADERRARQLARDWGRFTRNFVAQGTAAEWALCWMAGLRIRLRALADERGEPHLAFFLHDEVMVHSPAHLADAVTDAITSAAEDAGRLLFGRFPVNFALTVVAVSSYDQAK
ncbi:bifunctional 3'-5' exonuclease/DNA polymerase [Mycetocola zhadangensis]|uniref:DNA-directed DNA polymerase n=1 Tax=Mycetocola zhadangensis TaxID=1164595 RepID=A0A3L7J4W8_9MICO|nr:bifunctional 3'-5' exonuclease/DNA polymerase [Mycetocola zhadangensis]RLQ85643.1 bifunctional 3'-5' exonuclease/DNA polymerase [Mycetocola zhadangensis]GGE84411.1 bifunctional 3'-5' exonuclease/DNA polymerase [Mycetocola zhadangensis]